MKLNNKGFAITTIIYGTLVVFLLLLASLLGMLSTHKVRLQKLKEKTEEIIEDKELECLITATIDGETIDNVYGEKLVLTIKANKPNVTYSWDGTKYDETNTKSIASATTFTAYVKYNDEIKSCSLETKARDEYRKRNCTAKFGTFQWDGKYVLVDPDDCTGLRSESAAESGGYTSYQKCGEYAGGSTGCIKADLGPLCKVLSTFNRSCDWANCGSYSAWGTTKYTTTKCGNGNKTGIYAQHRKTYAVK